MLPSLRPVVALVASLRRYKSSSSVQGELFDKILIANRGIKTVAIYSDPDVNGIHVEAADEAVCVGPARSTLSYLNIPRVLAAIESTGAQAVHPGYGFLSENAAFVGELEKRGVVFIGPKASAMAALGDKINSKKLAIAAGVHTIPGYMHDIPNAEEAVRISRDIGYPVMVKASSGGGGKGMRVCYTDAEVLEGYRLSKQEAKSAFASDVVFVEKFIEEPRHIEVQLIADNHGNVVALPERECTIQRRNQKVIEESPSTFLDPATRSAMQAQAASLAKSVGYNSAGTVEFLVDKHKRWYFLEMNTRLQVEHPITEAVTGLDLVELMIRSAAGEPLPDALIKGPPLPILGHAFEARVYAEDPFRGFLPSTGRLSSYQPPSASARSDPELGEGIREDAGVAEGSEISMHYDPMICKLITHDATRQRALDRLTAALDAYVIRGVGHNISFLRDLCLHPRFREGRIDTSFIKHEYPEGFKGVTLSGHQEHRLLATAAIMNAIQQIALFEIQPRSPHAVAPNVETTLISLGQRTIVEGQAAAAALPRVFEASIFVSDRLGSGGEDGEGVGVGGGEEAASSSSSSQEAPLERADTALPRGDGNVWSVGLRELDPKTLQPLPPTSGGGSAPTIVRLANMDWAPAAHVFFAYDLDAPAAAPSSEAVVRVQLISRGSDSFRLQYAGSVQELFVRTPRAHALAAHMLPRRVRDMGRVLASPMPGTLVTLAVAAGDRVEEGQECAVVEAMKMQNLLRAPKRGIVKRVCAKAGETLALDQVIVEFE